LGSNGFARRAAGCFRLVLLALAMMTLLRGISDVSRHLHID
jgi:hypothetical protein